MNEQTQTSAQEAEYALPYHYIPTLRRGKFTSTRHWDWGFRYLGGIELAMDQLAGSKFESLLDVGCGDGRFLREVRTRYPGIRLLGIDSSKRAIGLAQALNPNLNFRVFDIAATPIDATFDVATLIEVIEHIPPSDLPNFIAATAKTLVAGGRLIVTVPHGNKPVIEKHYQHFTGAQLLKLLEPHFERIQLIPFDRSARRAPLMWLIERILGAKGRWFLFTNQRLLYLLYRLYVRRYLYVNAESRCERIAAVCVRKSTPS